METTHGLGKMVMVKLMSCENMEICWYIYMCWKFVRVNASII